jgi:hypothetical protein
MQPMVDDQLHLLAIVKGKQSFGWHKKIARINSGYLTFCIPTRRAGALLNLPPLL